MKPPRLYYEAAVVLSCADREINMEYFPDGDICSGIINISLQNYGKAIIMRLVKNAEYFTVS